MSTPVPVRLGYLLKHVQARHASASAGALDPFGIDARELAVLAVLDGAEPLSQQQVAGRLGVDRTTMVALVDALEGKRLVQRSPHPADRRKNVVRLTPAGILTHARAVAADDDAERRFLEPLGEDGGRRLKDSLRALLE